MKKMKNRGALRDRAYILPSLVTVSSLFAGFLSIVSSIQGNFDHAIKYIALAAILDVLDGGVARKLNAASDFGREFDSLCDLVAFGVAPAILAFEWAFKGSYNEFGVLASFLYLAGGATRLARFNVTTSVEPKSYFIGLPIPAAAASLSSVVYGFPQGVSEFGGLIVLIYTILLGGLMVSTFKFFSLKRLTVKKSDLRKYSLILFAIVALVWKFDRLSILLLLIAYILYGVLPAILRYNRGEKIPDPPQSSDQKPA